MELSLCCGFVWFCGVSFGVGFFFLQLKEFADLKPTILMITKNKNLVFSWEKFSFNFFFFKLEGTSQSFPPPPSSNSSGRYTSSAGKSLCNACI